MTDEEIVNSAYAAGQQPAAQPQAAPAPPAPVATGTDVALVDAALGLGPSTYGPDTSPPAQTLPPFEPKIGLAGTEVVPSAPGVEVPKLAINAGVKLQPLAAPDDIKTLDDFITDRAAVQGQEQMQRAVELYEAQNRGEWNPPPGWLHDIMLRINAQTPDLGGYANSVKNATLRFFGLPTEIPKTPSDWASMLLHMPEQSFTNMLTIGGMAGSAAKAAGQAAIENLIPGREKEAGAAEIVGATRGIGGLVPLWNEAVAKIGIPIWNTVGPALGMAPADRLDYLERTAHSYNTLSRLVHGEEALLHYDPTAAPGTEAVTEFVAGQAPFMLLPEASGLSE